MGTGSRWIQSLKGWRTSEVDWNSLVVQESEMSQSEVEVQTPKSEKIKSDSDLALSQGICLPLF